MPAKIYSAALIGLNCEIIEVEADISRGLSSFSIVGLGDASVQESKERVRSSIKNSGLNFPITKKTINLAPAEIKKQGSNFDLPIAVGILSSSSQIPDTVFEDSIVIGELSLSGDLKPVKGILPITNYAMQKGFKKIFLPYQNIHEASMVDGIDILGINSLAELVAFCRGQCSLSYVEELPPEPTETNKNQNTFSISRIFGLEKAKRGMIISAAGGHNVLLKGLPGTGKTLLAKSIQSLLPRLSRDDAFEVTKIYSAVYGMDSENPLIMDAPFRSVHHTASKISIIGGGQNVKPGEITLAHRGVLFLDELTEFPKSIIETLRQPLEDGYVIVSRIKDSIKFPAEFMLIATMNNCPCGMHSREKNNRCKCSEKEIENYRKRISGPILDRFDIFIETPEISIKNFLDREDENREAEIRNKIALVRAKQKERYSIINKSENARLQADEIKRFCTLSEQAKKILEKSSCALNLSNRGYLKTIKIAQTIADLENHPQISEEDILEALQYRSKI